MAGETLTGVTIMRVVKALDAGPMLATVHRAIGADVTSADVERELSVAGAHLLVETVDRLARGPVEEVAQDEAHATYAPRLTKDDGRIDWQRPARDVHNLVRGLHPWPLASSYLEGVRLIVRRTRIVPLDRSSTPGAVVAARGDSFIVAAGEGALELLEVQAEGSRAMSAREYLAGRRINPGAVFTAVP
jgi:methionyl-tRNA formyltransferase